LKRLVATQQRAWTALRTDIDAGVDAIKQQRPDSRLDPKILHEQIRLSIEFFDTPSSKDKPLGYQTEADWTHGLTSLQSAGAIKPGWKLADYYTNDLIPAA
jgi:NitT/TauT family transport system substrate-binding protein